VPGWYLFDLPLKIVCWLPTGDSALHREYKEGDSASFDALAHLQDWDDETETWNFIVPNRSVSITAKRYCFFKFIAWRCRLDINAALRREKRWLQAPDPQSKPSPVRVETTRVPRDDLPNAFVLIAGVMFIMLALFITIAILVCSCCVALLFIRFCCACLFGP